MVINRFFSGPTTRRRRLIAALTVALAGVLLVAEAGRFLAYTDPVRPADAAVLLIGKDLNARRLAAHELLCAGRARYLIVPAHGQVFICSEGSVLPSPPVPRRSAMGQRPTRISRFSKWIEDTHMEILLARGTVERMGLDAVVFVSSPYHMRRIKLIADRVFDGFDTRYFATPHEQTRGRLWWTSPHEIHWVLSEYTKIAWFLIYHPFYEATVGR